ncbi:MAG: hypothetical protein M1837_006643 [Sclerophora amabilis]|nr:MAG: hypothetical protein M1837_006643 [Sclerophora amabilis]
MSNDLPPLSQSFQSRKLHILQYLSTPQTSYTDASPKGSVDADVQPLIGAINGFEGLVTTSSCAGRVCVFVEGRKRKKPQGNVDDDRDEHYEEGEGDVRILDGGSRDRKNRTAGIGGKGGGGNWSFVSHNPIQIPDSTDSGETSAAHDHFTNLFGLIPPAVTEECEHASLQFDAATRLVHFKFEPMILHVLTGSPIQAHAILTAALQAGFRESGAVGPFISSSFCNPVVAIRCTGLSFDSIIGYVPESSSSSLSSTADASPTQSPISLVSEAHLQLLVSIANVRFTENARRRERFAIELTKSMSRLIAGSGSRHSKGDGHVNFDLERPLEGSKVREWEDTATRRQRKREEGLRRREEQQQQQQQRHQKQYQTGLDKERSLDIGLEGEEGLSGAFDVLRA